MAVKAAATITLYTAASVTAVCRYYKLQLSDAAAPAKPTVKPDDPQKEAPSGWEVAEPAYTTGSTNSLYTVDLNLFSDGTFQYSNVSLSSSYEAAKKAYNEAVETARKLVALCMENDTTYINGAKIYTGTVTAKQISIEDLKALQATIGGFSIGDKSISKGTSSLGGGDSSVYIGTDGISCGLKFKVEANGTVTVQNAKIGGELSMKKTLNGTTSGVFLGDPCNWGGSDVTLPYLRIYRSGSIINKSLEINDGSLVAHDSDKTVSLTPDGVRWYRYINSEDGFSCPELWAEPASSNGKSVNKFYSYNWLDDPTDYDDPLNECDYTKIPFDVEASELRVNGKSIVDMIYPVGSIYLSVNSVNPKTLFGGTWEQIKDKFLLAAGGSYSAGTTGGSADAVVVSHNHTMPTFRQKSGGVASGSTYKWIYYNTEGGGGIGTSTNGESGTGKNMPPYLAVYMWKRTA